MPYSRYAGVRFGQAREGLPPGVPRFDVNIQW